MAEKDDAKRNMNIMDISSIIQTLSAQKRTGTLRAVGPDNERVIYFNRGSVELVLADQRTFLLGEALLKYGKLTKEQLEEALKIQKTTNRELGKLLVELGYMSESDIREAIVFQITEEVCDIFTWPKVECEFLEGKMLPEMEKVLTSGVRVAVNPESLIMEAARRVDEWEIIKKIVPSTKDVFQATPESFHYFKEEEWMAEKEVLTYIDGVRDVAEIVQKAKMPKFEALKILYKLASNKEIERVPPARLVELGLQVLNKGDIKKAIRLLERAEELGGDELDVDIRLARAYEVVGAAAKAKEKYLSRAKKKEREGDFEEAVAAYERITQLDPDDLETHRRLVDVLIKQGRREEVVRQVQRLESKYIRSGDKKQAVELWKKVQEAFPDMPQTYDALAKLHIRFDENVQAIIELENLGGLYLLRGEREEALNVFRKILQLDEECVQARLSLASTLADLGRTAEALDEYHALADMLTKSGVIEGSNWVFLLDVYRRVAELEPENYEVRLKLADAYEKRGENQAATEFIEQVVGILREKKDVPKERLLEALQKIVERKPDDTARREELAECYFEVGKTQQAIKECLVDKAIEKKDYQKALKYCERIQKIEPLRIETFQRMATIFGLQGEKEKQFETLRRMAWLQICMSDYSAAEEALEKAAEVGAYDLTSSILLTEIYRKLGEKERLYSLLLRLATSAVKEQNLGLAERFLDEFPEEEQNDTFFELKGKLERLRALLKGEDRIPVIRRPHPSSRMRIVKPSSEETADEEAEE